MMYSNPGLSSNINRAAFSADTSIPGPALANQLAQSPTSPSHIKLWNLVNLRPLLGMNFGDQNRRQTRIQNTPRDGIF